MKCDKNTLQKIVGNILKGKLRKLYMSGTVIFKFVVVLKKLKVLGNICLSEQIFYRKQSLGATDHGSHIYSKNVDIEAITLIQT